MTANETCPDKTELESMLTGTLPPNDQTRVSLHLEDCSACQTTFEQLAAEAPWLPDRAASPASEPESALLRLMERLAGESPDAFAGKGPTYGDETPLPFLTPSASPEYLGELGPYNVVGVIGQGGMGIVLKAHDPRLNRFVAIKVLAPQLAVFAAARKRFLREAQSAAAIGHDQIVTIHSVDEVRGFPFIVMECVAGVSLAERIASDGALGLRETLRIGVQIASGLAAAHARGLIHRDIKPANILLAGGGKVKVTDFGLARAVGETHITHTGQITGTPEFMSPEQARGQSLDHRSDLFSLGCVLYTMYTGRSPFRGATPWEAIGRVCGESPRPLQDENARTPEWLTDIIDRLLAKNPDDRPQSAEEVAELLGGQFAQLPPIGAEDEPLRDVGVSPAQAAGAAAPQTLLRRPLIAASVALLMLFGIIAAWQIVIHIKRQGESGPETTVRVDEGSDVAVHNDGSVQVQLPPKGGTAPPPANVTAAPRIDADNAGLVAAFQQAADKAMDEDAPMGKMLGSKTIKRFSPADRLLTTDGVTADKDGWRIEAKGNRTVKLFEIRDPDVMNCWLMYHASVKAEKLDGKAELALWCHTRDGNVYRGNAPEPPEVTSVKNWATYSSLFKMRRGDRPTLIEVGAVIEGQGTIEIKKLRVNIVPLANIGEATAYGPAEKLRTFDTLAYPPATPGIVREKDGWRIEVKGNRSLRLFDIPTPHRATELGNCGLFGRAKIKTENLVGRAYLEIGTNEPDGKEWLAGGCYAQGGDGLPRGPAVGTTDWTSYESSVGHVGVSIGWWKVSKLNLVVEGHGTVWIKDVELLAAPTLPQAPAIAPPPGNWDPYAQPGTAPGVDPYAQPGTPPTLDPYAQPGTPPSVDPYVPRGTSNVAEPSPATQAIPLSPWADRTKISPAPETRVTPAPEVTQEALQAAIDKAFDDDGPVGKAMGRKTLKKFAPGDKLLTSDGVTAEKDFWHIEAKGNRTIKLFELRNPDAINSWLMFDAELRLEKLDGKAELAMWCHTRDGNVYRANAMPAPDVNSLSEWAPYDSVFKMRRGDRPTLIEVGVAIEGSGTLEIRKPRVIRMALQNEGTAYGPAEKLKDFDVLVEPSTTEGIVREKDGWRIEAKGDRTIRLFDIPTPRNRDAAMDYALFGRAKLKTENLVGRAYFDIGTVDPNGNGKATFIEHSFAPGFGDPRGPVSGTTDWTTYESADPQIRSNDVRNGRWKVVKLNLVIEGHGTVWVKDIGLFRAPKIDPPPEIKIGPVIPDPSATPALK